MSHFDDIEPIFYGSGPTTGCGAIIFLVIAGVAIWWAYEGDKTSKRTCEEHGEVYVDSREAYTLCQTDAGVVVRR